MVIDLIVYSVDLHGEDFTRNIFISTDKEKAMLEFKHAEDELDSDEVDQSGLSAELSFKTKKYKHIGGDEYPIQEYPIIEYYDDEEVYEYLDESEWETLEFRDIDRVNKKTDEILSDIQIHYKNKYGHYKYNSITIEDDDGNEIGCIKLRVADHTENIRNIDRYGDDCDFYISVVIAEYDPTKKKFWSNNFERRRNEYELVFDSSYEEEEIINKIDDLIEELSEEIVSRTIQECLRKKIKNILKIYI